MATHLHIISRAGGYKKLADAIGVERSRARFWERRGAIPADVWLAISHAGLATLEELATGAASIDPAQALIAVENAQ